MVVLRLFQSPYLRSMIKDGEPKERQKEVIKCVFVHNYLINCTIPPARFVFYGFLPFIFLFFYSFFFSFFFCMFLFLSHFLLSKFCAVIFICMDYYLAYTLLYLSYILFTLSSISLTFSSPSPQSRSHSLHPLLYL